MSKIARFPIKPCFPYVGGKTRMLKHILHRIPPHTRYLEPFAGGLAVLLAKEPSRVEAINDLNDELVIFYRYVRHHLPALKAELANFIHSRSEFEALLKTTPTRPLQQSPNLLE